MRLKLTLEYDGTGFHGWARQPGLRTVEGELRSALEGVFPRWERLAVAGRTDAGVHALAQVASVEVKGGPPAERVPEALDSLLPDDLTVTAAEVAAPDFHARHSARSRSYRYRIWTRRTPSPYEARRSLWHPRPLDEEALAASAELLLGGHDFRAFTPTDSQHEVFVRVVEEAGWRRESEDVLVFEITADSFLRHMVRALVGSMLELSPNEIGRVLEACDRSQAGPTAPAWGLYLVRVEYS